MTDFYPEIEPYASGMLPVDDIHTLYWEECGNPEGLPVVFLHGGPGAGAGPSSRRFFDPEAYRIIVFEQRGSGRSTPLGEIRQNTTPLLIEDIEKLRRHLHVDRWVVFGGSWGSTLAFAYAEHHPDRCIGLILRGIFLCRRSEIQWFFYGMRTVFPEAWRAFNEFIPEGERGDLEAAYHKYLMDPDPAIHMPAARSYSFYEGTCATLYPTPEVANSFLDDTVALGLSRMESHYFKNNIFLPENYLLDNIHRIRHIPCVMVQGRYDIVCPIVTADEVSRAWPEAEYIIVPDAGHSSQEPGIKKELILACERFKSLPKA
jgi:proline iminopeptidase